MPPIEVNDEVYDLVPDEVRIAIEYLLSVREKLGITDDFEIEEELKGVPLRYVLEIYKTWGALYPEERKSFINNTEFELKYERGVKDAIKAGGYSPTSFPMRFERLINVLMPNVRTQDKRFWKPLFSHIPELKRSNYA